MIIFSTESHISFLDMIRSSVQITQEVSHNRISLPTIIVLLRWK